MDQVLEHIKKFYPHDSLSDKDLTLKTTALLALTAASRCSELKYLDVRYTVRSNNTFTFAKLFKNWRKEEIDLVRKIESSLNVKSSIR